MGGVPSFKEVTLLSLQRTFFTLSNREWMRGFYSLLRED
jgi:hypothetical protein